MRNFNVMPKLFGAAVSVLFLRSAQSCAFEYFRSHESTQVSRIGTIDIVSLGGVVVGSALAVISRWRGDKQAQQCSKWENALCEAAFVG